MGNTIITAEAGETIAANSAVYFNSSGIAFKAVLSDPTKFATAFCVTGATSGNTAQFFRTGEFAYTTSAMPGSFLYLSSTAGGITDTKPVGAFQVVGQVIYEDWLMLLFGERVVLQSDSSIITSTSSPATLTSNVDNLINHPTLQATFTVNLPAEPTDGDIVTLTFNSAVTALTVSGNGNDLAGVSLTAAAIGTRAVWKYYSTIDKWLRIQ